ncbi:MAG: hypothetical protein V3V33_10195 [Candidatus Lokiarchaeia archaeon]
MEETKKLSKILKTIGSPIKLRILNLLCNKEMSLNEIQIFIFKEYDIKYPQTTYNYIETLVDNNLVEKKYSQQEKVIKYKIIGKKLKINFENIEFNLK